MHLCSLTKFVVICYAAQKTNTTTLLQCRNSNTFTCKQVFYPFQALFIAPPTYEVLLDPIQMKGKYILFLLNFLLYLYLFSTLNYKYLQCLSSCTSKITQPLAKLMMVCNKYLLIIETKKKDKRKPVNFLFYNEMKQWSKYNKIKQLIGQFVMLVNLNQLK